MTEFLEIAALVVWLGVGLYVWRSTRHLNRRMNNILDSIEGDLHDGR